MEMKYSSISINIENNEEITDEDLKKLEDEIEEALQDGIHTLEERLPKLPKGANWSVY